MAWYWIVLIVLGYFMIASIALIIIGSSGWADGNEESAILPSLMWPVTLVLIVVAGVFGATTIIVANILDIIKLGIDKLKGNDK